MCLCRSERTSFTNGNLKGSINAGRYTADYLQCGNLPYLAWKNAHNCADLSYRRIRRYLVWRLKRLEARDFSRVRIKFLIHSSILNTKFFYCLIIWSVFVRRNLLLVPISILHFIVRLSNLIELQFEWFLNNVFLRSLWFLDRSFLHVSLSISRLHLVGQ